MIDYNSYIPTAYILWLLFLFFLPIMIFFRYTRIDNELLDLKGLKLTPRLVDGNVVCVSNNFSAFMKMNPTLSLSNAAVKIFKDICTNAESGNYYNPNLYIVSFKTTLRKFVLWVLLGSHIPLLCLLLIFGIPFGIIIRYQVFCYLLVYLVEMAVQYRLGNFSRILYTNWYNRIMNFDLLTVKLIRYDVEKIKELTNSRELLEAANKFEGANTTLVEYLSKQTEMLTGKMDQLLNIQQQSNGITAQSILLSLDNSIEKYKEVNEHIQAISGSIRDSYQSITGLSEERKDEINSINKNSELLLDIRENFKNYQSEAFKTEISQFQAIGTSLDHNVSKTLVSAGNIIEQNFKRLEEGYSQFFDVCKELGRVMSGNYEEKTASALTLLLNNLTSEYSETRKIMEKTGKLIEEAAQVNELLCKSVYEFTQFSTVPPPKEKITGLKTYFKRVKDARKELFSYFRYVFSGIILKLFGKKKRKNKKNKKEENTDKENE